MHLKYCEINNFRSIKQLKIDFCNNFQILVGLNEAGKSNILKALSFINPKIEPKEDDIRDPGYAETPLELAYLRFVFGLDAAEIKHIFDCLKLKFKAKNINIPIMCQRKKELSLEDLCGIKKEGLYTINLIDKNRESNYWEIADNSLTSSGNWKRIPSGWAGYEDFENNEFEYICIHDYPKYNDNDQLEDISPEQIYSSIGGSICDLIDNNLPDCMVWNYTENNILPSEIDMASFSNNPDTCEPLRNIFYLSGYDDIEKSITDAQSKTNGVRNLLRKLSDNATKYLNSVWPEYKSISINLCENGDNIEMGIEDTFNIYSLSRRSDGFKRFITFLLMISAKVKADYLSNTIILIDEPDIGLHPTGVKFLREELEKISKKNTVIVSSHSIFMIDKERVDRHLIVKKNDEVTQVTIGSVSDILDEEVIYRALGFSLVDLLKQNNIIFEGWCDKHTFQRWLKSKSVNSNIKNQWKDIGLTHALGAKYIARVAGMLESFGRNYFIITDSDQPSLEWKDKFKGDGEWLTFKDLGFENKETVEDFLDQKYVDSMIKRVLQKEQVDADISFEECPNFNAKIKLIKTKMALSKAEAGRLSKLIKNQIFEELPPMQIHLELLVESIDISSDGRFQQAE